MKEAQQVKRGTFKLQFKPLLKSSTSVEKTGSFLTPTEIDQLKNGSRLDILCEDDKFHPVTLYKLYPGYALHFPYHSQKDDVYIPEEKDIADYYFTSRAPPVVQSKSESKTNGKQNKTSKVNGTSPKGILICSDEDSENSIKENEVDGSKENVLQNSNHNNSNSNSNSNDNDNNLFEDPHVNTEESEILSQDDEYEELTLAHLQHYSNDEDKEWTVYHPISPETLPLSLFNESIESVCLDSTKQLNQPASRLLELMNELNNNEKIVDVLKESIENNNEKIFTIKNNSTNNSTNSIVSTTSIQKISKGLSLMNGSTKMMMMKPPLDEKKRKDHKSIERLLEENLSKYQKIEELNFKHRIISTKKENVLNFLTNSVFEMARKKVNQEIESFVFDNGKKSKK